VLAGDRRATAGNMIAKRDVEKVFRSDEFSAVGCAGTGSVGIEFVRLFQVGVRVSFPLPGDGPL
jgi:proteasome beta subunit